MTPVPRLLSIRPRIWAALALVAALSVLAGRAAAKCGGRERSWSLELVSVSCDRGGTDCIAEKASVAEGAHWEATGTLNLSSAADSVWISARTDGSVAGHLSEVSP